MYSEAANHNAVFAEQHHQENGWLDQGRPFLQEVRLHLQMSADRSARRWLAHVAFVCGKQHPHPAWQVYQLYHCLMMYVPHVMQIMIGR